MSDLSMYELEDIIWDDFGRGDDHIVPHPTNARTRRKSFEGDSFKKPRHAATPISNTARNLDASINCQGKAERDSKPLDKKKNMMEKESPSHAPPGICNASCDGEIVKGVPNLASDDTSNCFKSSYVTSSSELCVDDPILIGPSAAGDNNSYSYPVTHISRSEDLCFVDNNCENRQSGDLLYYGWPDIGNFEDVDKMLRSCDSSFGLGVTDNGDELGWFTSDQVGGTEEALKMDFRFPFPDPIALKNISPHHDSPDSSNQRSCCISENKNELNYKHQKKQSKHHNQTEEKKAGQFIGNDGSLYQVSDMESNDTQVPAINISEEVFTSVGNRQKYRNLEIDSFGHMQNNVSYLPPEYPYQATTDPMGSGIKSGLKGLKSPSPKGSSYPSNQVHIIKSSDDPSFEGTAAEVNGQKQARKSQGLPPLFAGSPRQIGMMFQTSKGVLVSAEKQADLEFESQSDIEGVQKGILAEIGSLNVPEISSVSSELDEISLEATSFRQLQQVMEQLDLRTKLCIRDSLYRLATSAEQRHNNQSLSGDKKCGGLMDMETDTNPIDRSVAHLLFHRPSESHVNPRRMDGWLAGE